MIYQSLLVELSRNIYIYIIMIVYSSIYIWLLVKYVVARGDWVVAIFPGCGPEGIGGHRAVWSVGPDVSRMPAS